MTRHRHAIAKARTGGQGTTSRPNQTDETGTENKDEAGNARGKGTRGEERTGPDDRRTRPDPVSRERRGTRGRPEQQARRKRTNAVRERHDTIRSKQNRRPARSRKSIARSHIPRPGAGDNSSKQTEKSWREGVGRKKKKSPEPPLRNDEIAHADNGIEHEQARANNKEQTNGQACRTPPATWNQSQAEKMKSDGQGRSKEKISPRPSTRGAGRYSIVSS